MTNLFGEGVLFFGVLFEYFSVCKDVSFGNIFNSQFSGFSIGLAGAEIGLILLVWIDFLNPKDNANPLVVGS